MQKPQCLQWHVYSCPAHSLLGAKSPHQLYVTFIMFRFISMWFCYGMTRQVLALMLLWVQRLLAAFIAHLTLLSFPFKPVYTVIVCAGEHIRVLTLNGFSLLVRAIGPNPFTPFLTKLLVALISGSSCPVIVAGADLEWFGSLTVYRWQGLVFFLTPHTCACSPWADHSGWVPLMSAMVWPEMMLKIPKPNLFWSLPFHSFSLSSLCLLSPSSLLFFSQLNCKYQVPFILFYFVIFIIVIILLFL